MLRFPGYLGPALYCTSICYQTIASPLMLLAALALDVDGTLPRSMLWGLLASATTTLLLGLGVAWCYMIPKYRKAFYKHMPFKRSLDEWAWEQRTACAYGEGSDASKANVLSFAPWTWPANEKVRD